MPQAEAPTLWPSDVKSWLTEKDPDAGKNWRQKEKRATEDEMVGWHPLCNGHKLGQTLGDGDGQGGLACSDSWGHKELDMTELLNWNGQQGDEPVSPIYSLEGLMLMLKLQYFGYLMQQSTHRERPWCWEKLKAEGEEGDRGWEGWMASPIRWTWTWTNSGSWWVIGKPGML